jgi:hypothetical protein
MKKKARSGKSKKSNRPTGSATRTQSVRPATSASEPPSAPTLAALEVAPRALEPDEISIPPAVDLDDSFFHAARTSTSGASAGEPQHVHADEDDREPVSQKMTARVRARRKHLSKYVKGTVAVAAAVCAMAMIRASIGGAHKDADPTPVANAEQRAVVVPAVEAPAPPVAAAAPVPVDVPPPPAEAQPQPPPAEPVVEAKAADVKAADVKPADVKPAAGTGSTKSALEEKRTSRAMLERGKIGAAIESGERAIALDPTDGEAWLILGAAYQEKGRPADARRAFTSCIKEGKKGPIGECRAMLR